MIVLAAVNDSIANFVEALIGVYVILIIAYIVVSLVQQFANIPYYRWLSAIFGFLRDVVEPYLSLFRRFIPPIGPLDISPIIAILVLQIVGLWIVVPLIRG